MMWLPKVHSQGDTSGDELSGESSSSNDDAIAEVHGQGDVDDVIVPGTEPETELATNEKAEDDFMVGQYVVARYDGQWHIAVVEGEEPDGEEMNIEYTLHKYLERKGEN